MPKTSDHIYNQASAWGTASLRGTKCLLLLCVHTYGHLKKSVVILFVLLNKGGESSAEWVPVETSYTYTASLPENKHWPISVEPRLLLRGRSILCFFEWISIACHGVVPNICWIECKCSSRNCCSGFKLFLAFMFINERLVWSWRAARKPELCWIAIAPFQSIMFVWRFLKSALSASSHATRTFSLCATDSLPCASVTQKNKG